MEFTQVTGAICSLEDNQNMKATRGLQKYVSDKDYLHHGSHAGHGGFLGHRDYAGQ